VLRLQVLQPKGGMGRVGAMRRSSARWDVAPYRAWFVEKPGRSNFFLGRLPDPCTRRLKITLPLPSPRCCVSSSLFSFD
jgi:hypothetical protein